MKKLLLSGISALIGTSAFAQLPVSQSAENKNVVLEEFTGIYCQFCPDGHKRAQDLKNANPGDIVLINIHTGGFANPSGGDPDFRTNFGAGIAGQSGLTGYPAGTVNRADFTGNGWTQGGGTAMSRGDWTSAAGVVLGESSYVNVALEADVDLATREMTIDVEAYFTGNGAASVNLNVAISQNNVEGPQTGAATWYPQNILSNGMYNHQHMLRDMPTGQWGEVITTTTQGSMVQKQYTWVVPNDINGVPVALGDLEVVAFIAEGQQNIITGAYGPVSFTAPPGTTIIDLAAGDNTTIPTDLCENLITPSINVENVSNDDATAFEVSYSIDGGTPVTETINQALAAGANMNHDFAQVGVSGGAHTISYNVSTINGGSEVEIVTSNNSSSSDAFVTIPQSAEQTLLMEDFESYSAGDETWNNTAMFANGDFFVINQSMFTGIPNALGGYANSDKSFRHRLYSMNAGQVNEIITFKYAVDNLWNLSLDFDHAANGLDAAFTDKLEIYVSEDCGATWTSVFSAAGSALETGPANNQATFYPTGQQWATNNVDLSAYNGTTGELTFKFEITGSGQGNCLYLDNIMLTGQTSSTEEVSFDGDVKIYPNPSNGNTFVNVNLNDDAQVNISIIDLAGKTVATSIANGNGTHELPTAGLSKGVYMVNMVSGSQVQREKLVIE